MPLLHSRQAIEPELFSQGFLFKTAFAVYHHSQFITILYPEENPLRRVNISHRT